MLQGAHSRQKDITFQIMNDKELERYGRHILLPEVDYEGQQKLLNAHVVIVGVGGLGSPAALYLASSGIKKLTICDFDKVDLSNLQRQVIYNEENLNEKKVIAAKNNLLKINSNIDIQTIDQKLNEFELEELLNNGVDVLLDCSDNFHTRYIINKVSFKTSTPLVSGSAIRMQGQLCVFDFRFKEKIGCYECIFPNNNVDEELRCADHGILAPVVGIIGTMQALEAIKLILNINNMQSKFLLFDGNQNEWKVVKYHKDKECKICSASSI